MFLNQALHNRETTSQKKNLKHSKHSALRTPNMDKQVKHYEKNNTTTRQNVYQARQKTSYVDTGCLGNTLICLELHGFSCDTV